MPGSTLSRSDLHALVWSTPMKAAAARLGLSPNGLAKICDRLLVPHPPRGFWNKAPGERPEPAPLPPSPAPDLDQIVIADGRAASRRTRSRLTPEARRDQLLHAAAALVAGEGVGAVSIKRIARDVGVSEALAFTYFNSRAELLAAVARRELAAMDAYQRAEIERGHSPGSRVRLSTIAYLRQIEERGSILHVLLSAPEVRLLLRPQRQSRRARNGGAVSARLTDRYGVPDDLAYAATQALSAATRRAGRLVATGKISRPAAERLILIIVEQGNRDLVAAARPAAIATSGPEPR